MFFLLRMAFWLGVVCLLLPASGTKSPDGKIDATEAMTVASAAVSDARGFCGRQPDACVTGGKVAVALGQRRQRPPELDDIAVAVVPLVQQGEIVEDLVDSSHSAIACGGQSPASADI